MANSVILPGSYQDLLIYEGFKSNLLEDTLDMSNDPDFDVNVIPRQREQAYKIYRNQRQKFFQTILLYDNLILPEADPTVNFGRLDDYGFKIYEIEESLGYDARTESDYDLKVISLKNAIVDKFVERHKFAFPQIELSASPKEIAEAIYDECFNLRTLNESEKNEIKKLMLYIKRRAMSITPSDYDSRDTEFLSNLTSNVFSEMSFLYNDINWLLNLSADNNAYIINSGYNLTDLGIVKNKKFDAYRTLKIAYKDAINELPGFNNLKEVLNTKKQKKRELNGLRCEISAIEQILSSNNPDRELKALEKATNDLKLAVAAVNKGLPIIEAVGGFSTVIGIPMSASSFFCSAIPLSITGLAIAVTGGAMFVVGKKLEKKKWCEIIR